MSSRGHIFVCGLILGVTGARFEVMGISVRNLELYAEFQAAPRPFV